MMYCVAQMAASFLHDRERRFRLFDCTRNKLTEYPYGFDDDLFVGVLGFFTGNEIKRPWHLIRMRIGLCLIDKNLLQMINIATFFNAINSRSMTKRMEV